MNNASVPIVAITGLMPMGGSSTFLINLAAGLRDFGHCLPVIVMSEHAPYAPELGRAGARLHAISRADSIYEDRIAEVYRITASYRPRMVLSCLSAESFEILRYMPPGVLRTGMVQADDEGVYAMAATFARWLDKVVGVSGTIGRRLGGMDEFSGDMSVTIPYGIQFPPAPHRTINPSSPLRVIYAGRLGEVQKRISRVVAVVSALATASRKFAFTFVGSGPESEQVRSQVGYLPGVSFAGEMDNAGVLSAFANHDVTILLSDFEGLPLALLEAMGMGCVPVVSDLESGIREVVTDDCGIRVPVGDVPAAIAALEKLNADRNLLAALSDTGMRKARDDYSATRMAKSYLQLAERAPGSSEWKQRLNWIHVPKAIEPWWHYAQPVRSLRRLRKWALGTGGT